MTILDDLRAPDGAGPLCLQGGAEFGRACQDMDQVIVSRSPMGKVVVLPAAADRGDAYDIAGRNASRYYSRWVGADVRVAPDPREEAEACADVIGQATLIVLPGGSPSTLLESLQGVVGEAIERRWRDGAGVSGASAGAMVLCERLLLPDRDAELVDGLGLLPGLALPHHTGEDRWADRLPADLVRWGLPECGGVLLDGKGLRAVGAGTPVVIEHGETTPLPR